MIKEAEAIERLQNEFNKNILLEAFIFEDIPIEASTTEELDIIEREYEPIGGDVDESNSEEPQLEIMGTFQTIKFKN